MQLQSKVKNKSRSRNRDESTSRISNKAKQVDIDAGKVAGEALSRKQIEYCLGHLAQYDVLTDLPNRCQFHDRLTGAMARAARHRQMVGIMLLNVDSFKAINI